MKLSAIEKLEKDRNSRVILYFTGEKEPKQQFATQIASDVLPLFREILENFGDKQNKITLVLNTSGGHLEIPWPLVNLIREYCITFEVLVLEKALSAGTMIALGADKIIMQPYSSLSPIDPAANIVDGEKNQVKKLEIEDIIGYINFAKEKVGIAEQGALAEIMKELSREIPPTLLGSVNRTHSLIRRLAKSLLYLHKSRLTDKQIKEITQNLTQNLYSHRHLINRKEAKGDVGFGSIIEFAKATTKKIADELFEYALTELQMNEDFNPEKILEKKDNAEYKLPRAILHTSDIKYSFVSNHKIIKSPDPSGKVNIMINQMESKWEKV